VKNSRRMKRMARNRQTTTRMNLTSLMDVFTILVFFLLVNSASTEVLETPKRITLPASIVEEKPRETVVVFISREEVTVQGEAVARTADLMAREGRGVAAIGERLAEVRDSVIGLRTRTVAESQEVTILADKSVPFHVIKRVMSACTAEGYGRISLAVLQKASKVASQRPAAQAS
jgi:biopolymer transport protein ExbD